WPDRPRQFDDPHMAEYEARLRQALDARADRLGEHAVQNSPPGRSARLGRCPMTRWSGWTGRTAPPKLPPTGRCMASAMTGRESALGPPATPPRARVRPGVGRCDTYLVALTVLIVDDHEGFRRVARELLEADGVEVVGEAADGESAITEAERLRPQLVLLDVQLPDIDGFEVAARLGQAADPP